MRIMPPANLPPRSSRAAAAHGRRGQRRRRRICACCFKVITKPDSRAQPESSFLPCRIPTRLRASSFEQFCNGRFSVTSSRRCGKGCRIALVVSKRGEQILRRAWH